MISILIPVKNGGSDLGRLLDSIAVQRVGDAVEVVVVDSGSSDGSVRVARKAGARVHEIEPDEFGHGTTRNLAASLAEGDILVFTSQDAYAASRDWLERLTAPLHHDPRLAGVYGRQLAHEDARPPEVFFLDFLYGPDARMQRATRRDQLTMETTMFSNVNAAVRASVLRDLPFAEDLIMSEDQEWAGRALIAGWELRYEPDAAVRHSHPYTIRSAFRRFFDSGVSADRAYLAGERPSARVLRRRAADYARREIAWLARSGKVLWIPYAGVYELAKFAGLQLGARHERLPLWLKRRLTALPHYWD